jgi:hypothetical protein
MAPAATLFEFSSLVEAGPKAPTKPASSRPRASEYYVSTVSDSPLPVELTSFNATSDDGTVIFTWRTVSEVNNAGFRIQHQESDTWATLAFIEGEGTTTEPQDYRLVEKNLPTGLNRFRLVQVDLSGETTIQETVAVRLEKMDTPLEFPPPAPHPVQDQTTITFKLREAAPTTLTLYNSLGERVALLYEGTPSSHQPEAVRLDASNFASGMYFLRLDTSDHMRTRRVVIVR